MSINVLLTLVEQYKEAAQLIEAAQAEQEQLKIQIREALAERSTNYLEVFCAVAAKCARTKRHYPKVSV